MRLITLQIMQDRKEVGAYIFLVRHIHSCHIVFVDVRCWKRAAMLDSGRGSVHADHIQYSNTISKYNGRSMHV